jgi:LacI family transcriptional regulator
MHRGTTNNGPLRRIAVLIETDDTWGRSVIQGVADYARAETAWVLLIEPRDRDRRLALPEGWDGDGVVARLGSRWMADHLKSRGLPVVDTDTVVLEATWAPRVITDDDERARLALEHFRDRGFRKFAYFAPPKNRYSRVRGEAFVRAVEGAGFPCSVFRPGYSMEERIGWNEQHEHVRRWLTSLERPIAIFAVDAHRGRELTETCHVLGIDVPHEISILAGDTDELMCSVSTPPLSSVQLASQRIGYDAAALLDRMLAGEPPPARPLRLKPLGVVARQSTDILTVPDQTVAEALRFIRDHAARGILVQDVLREVPVSRRGLEIQFKRALGRSPAAEIRRVRLEKGRELLTTTDLSVSEIASACGFSNATRLGVAFRNRYGMTPVAFRRHARGR